MMPWVEYSGKITRSMPGRPSLHADDHVGDLAGVVEHLGLGVQARHLVVDDRDADGVVAGGNVTVKHWDRLLFWFGFDADRAFSG